MSNALLPGAEPSSDTPSLIDTLVRANLSPPRAADGPFPPALEEDGDASAGNALQDDIEGGDDSPGGGARNALLGPDCLVGGEGLKLGCWLPAEDDSDADRDPFRPGLPRTQPSSPSTFPYGQPPLATAPPDRLRQEEPDTPDVFMRYAAKGLQTSPLEVCRWPSATRLTQRTSLRTSRSLPVTPHDPKHNPFRNIVIKKELDIAASPTTGTQRTDTTAGLEVARPPFVAVLLNGTHRAELALPEQGEATHELVPAGLYSDGPLEVQIVAMMPSVFIPAEAKWRVVLTFHSPRHRNDVELGEFSAEHTDSVTGVKLQEHPTRIQLKAVQLAQDADASTDPCEAKLLEALKSIFNRPDVNPRGGSLAVSVLRRHLREPDHSDALGYLNAGRWQGNLEVFLADFPNVFLVFSLTAKEIESRGLDCEPHEPRAALTLAERRSCKAVDSIDQGGKQEVERRLLRRVEELLRERDYEQRDLLDKLAEVDEFLFYLSPSFSTLMRFLAKHKEIFAWTTHPDKPTQIGLASELSDRAEDGSLWRNAAQQRATAKAVRSPDARGRKDARDARKPATWKQPLRDRTDSGTSGDGPTSPPAAPHRHPHIPPLPPAPLPPPPAPVPPPPTLPPGLPMQLPQAAATTAAPPGQQRYVVTMPFVLSQPQMSSSAFVMPTPLGPAVAQPAGTPGDLSSVIGVLPSPLGSGQVYPYQSQPLFVQSMPLAAMGTSGLVGPGGPTVGRAM
eukprot:TRINITY_DN5284_c4_g1_i1.p1 TRINITY_DN5284_c4_g1~~TRINITY_DN5284_c4_g1_i1.p1  ORF type:complete len:733 (+),score=229.05 TRINITY_DN5284_c4_g1_i1:82-2280(+)